MSWHFLNGLRAVVIACSLFAHPCHGNDAHYRPNRGADNENDEQRLDPGRQSIVAGSRRIKGLVHPAILTPAHEKAASWRLGVCLGLNACRLQAAQKWQLFHAPVVRIMGMGKQACNRIRLAPIIATTLLVAVFAYPLSTGPAILLLGAPSCPLHAKQILHQIYDPLFEPPIPYRVQKALYSWVDLWDLYGLRDESID